MGGDQLGFGGGAAAGGLASMIPPMALEMLQNVLEDSIRKIELDVTYDSAYGEESILVELYVAEASRVTGAMGGLGQIGGGEGGLDEDLDGALDEEQPPGGEGEGPGGGERGGGPGAGREDR